MVKKYSFIEWTYVEGAHWDCLYEAIPLCTNTIRKPNLKYTLNKYHVHWLSSFNHLKLSISIEIPVTIYLHDSYITKLDFLNYAFAKLVLAW